MKIIHLTSGNITGGAARGAYFLHKSLKEQGVDSRFFIVDRLFEDEFEDVEYLLTDVKEKLERYRNRKFEQFVLSEYPQKNSFFSLGKGVFDEKILELSQEADIIHLHWINDQMLSLETLSKINIPIVWTFRDMWPFTGGCHYSNGCEKYKVNCGSCKLLNSYVKHDVTNWIYLRKLQNYHNVHPVAISRWLAECANSSSLLSDKKVHVIPNSIDSNVFMAFNKVSIRQKKGLPLDKKIIAFGAINAYGDERKGFKLLIDALQLLKNKKDYHLITFGGDGSEALKEVGISYTDFGIVNDNYMLSQIYSAAHVFIAPSIEEAFGKTIVESMSCETPVVAFNATGPADIIKHGETGYLSHAYEVDDMAKGIEFIAHHPEYELLSEKSRQEVALNYRPKKMANLYRQLYQEILQIPINKKKEESIVEEGKEIFDIQIYVKRFEKSVEVQWDEQKKWYVFDNKRDQVLSKIGGRKVAIYGTGEFGKEVLTILNFYNIPVDVFIDSNKSLHGEIVESYRINSLEECKDYFVFIASTWYTEIERVLCENGFTLKDYVICMK
ncbi:glycosyltransferase [Lysinibacillus sp. NPDC047702]|uniref:glycosyltransferase family 4 protein n=1 Tax=unclassified Lysinibacillus TaxID=2636778 RepID=UPI003CFCED1E